MKGRKVAVIIVSVIILLCLISSGWVYNLVRSNSELIESNEMATIQATFVQQYGSGATINQLVSPDKVYAAVWTDEDGKTHVSWSIAGVWAVVWSSPPPTP